MRTRFSSLLCLLLAGCGAAQTELMHFCEQVFVALVF